MAGAVSKSRSEASRPACALEGGGEGWVVGGAVVVDVVGAEDGARELLQQVGFFVGGAVGADDADGSCRRALSRISRSFLPAKSRASSQLTGCELAVGLADERLGEAVFVIGEVEGVAALVAEEVAVDAALVAVVAADNLDAVVGGAHAEGGLAAVAAVRADGADVVHLPRAGLVAIGAGGERADGADVDAHAALFAVEVILVVRRDDAGDAAVLDAERPDVHAFAADADAAVAEDAARAVEVDDRRPLLLFAMLLGLDVEAIRARRT